MRTVIKFIIEDSEGYEYSGECIVKGDVDKEWDTGHVQYFPDVDYIYGIELIKFNDLDDKLFHKTIKCDSLATMPDQFRQIDVNELERGLVAAFCEQYISGGNETVVARPQTTKLN